MIPAKAIVSAIALAAVAAQARTLPRDPTNFLVKPMVPSVTTASLQDKPKLEMKVLTKQQAIAFGKAIILDKICARDNDLGDFDVYEDLLHHPTELDADFVKITSKCAGFNATIRQWASKKSVPRPQNLQKRSRTVYSSAAEFGQKVSCWLTAFTALELANTCALELDRKADRTMFAVELALVASRQFTVGEAFGFGNTCKKLARDKYGFRDMNVVIEGVDANPRLRQVFSCARICETCARDDPDITSKCAACDDCRKRLPFSLEQPPAHLRYSRHPGQEHARHAFDEATKLGAHPEYHDPIFPMSTAGIETELPKTAYRALNNGPLFGLCPHL